MALTERQTKRKVWLESMLTAIEGRLSGDIESGGSNMSINGRSLQRYTLDELNTMYRQYSSELTQLERVEQGRPSYGSIKVCF